MEQIERFYMNAYDPGDGCLGVSYEKYNGGDWVRYEDHERIVKELESRCERLNRECQEKAIYILKRQQQDDRDWHK